MKNFKDGGFRKGGVDFKKKGTDFGFKPKFGGGDKGGFKGGERGGDRGGRSFTPRPQGDLFPATCSTCHKPCEVPFKPSSDKPVYCSACFGKKNQDETREFRGDDKRGDREFKRDARPQREERAPRFESVPKSQDADLIEMKRQLSSLEGKMNRVLDLLNAQANAPEDEVAAIPVVTKVAKASSKKVVAKTSAKKSITKVAKTLTKKAATKTPTKKVAIKTPAKKAKK